MKTRKEKWEDKMRGESENRKRERKWEKVGKESEKGKWEKKARKESEKR